MTKNKKRSGSFCPEESNVVEALEGLREGDERPVAGYAHELAEIEKLLASLFDPGSRLQLVFRGEEHRSSSGSWSKFANGPENGQGSSRQGAQDPNDEWVGSFLQIKAAIESGSLEVLGAHFRDQARFHKALVDGLSGRGRSPWQLSFRRKRRGRPSADALKQLRTDSWTERELRFATLKSGRGETPGKQDSAISDLKEKIGSRATIMRRVARKRARSRSVQASLTKSRNE